MSRRSWLRNVLPWWAVAALGVACVVLGAVLTARPLRSLAVLALLTAAALVITGIGELTTAAAARRPRLARLAGVVVVASGAVVVAWPGVTILVLAVAAGVGLVVGGLLDLAGAVMPRADDPIRRAGDNSLIAILGGATSVIVGVIALSWPAVTVLVLAVAFGLRTVVFGVGLIAAGWRTRRSSRAGHLPDRQAERRWPPWARTVGTVVAFTLALAGMAVSVAVHRSQPGEPGAFYVPPSPLPDAPPGTVIRREVVAGFQPGATTHRVLYLSTGFDGEPAAVSGLVIVPDGAPPPGGRKIVAYTHGTVGVASRCGPSVQGLAWGEFMRSEGLDRFVGAGYVVAASDYQGLGTPGPHPYLVGESEAMNELDAVRAARSIDASDAGADVAVWGHSQGGHAALFTGQLASAYAPELNIVGVAAGAPVPDLVELFKVNVATTVGKILISMALQSWTEVYDAASLDQIVTPAARPAVRRIARNCLYGAVQIIGSVPTSAALGLTFLSNPPWETEPWATIVTANNPGQAVVGVPVLLTQGAVDDIVAPGETEALAQRMCANGDQVQFAPYPGVGHIDGGPAAAADVAEWIGQRFAAAPAPTDTCG